MIEQQLFVLFAGLVLDWFAGDPDRIWKRFPHPVVWFGKAVELADYHLNLESDTALQRYRKGALSWTGLVLIAIAGGLVFDWVLQSVSWVGTAAEIVVVSVFLAQKSLRDHVAAVARALREDGLDGARAEVARIVGRDPQKLDTSGVARASIESLAENFSDGVVAPAFWYSAFGLPGLFAYKMINTADSMIGHHSEEYEDFGRVAAKADDLANWLPARLSALLLAAGGGFTNGFIAVHEAVNCAMGEARLHRSPNAGWPEAAMAGAGGFALGGPRFYAGELVQQAHLNASGKLRLGAGDVQNALRIFAFGCFSFWGVVMFVALAL